jgi:acetyl esterase/lipase
MPLDVQAKRLLVMMAAASPADRVRPAADARRQALQRLMQFARADVAAASAVDGVLPGPAGDLAYRLYSPADAAGETLPGFVFFHGGGMVAGSIETHDRIAAALDWSFAATMR